jgi:hypothetical protein
MFTIILHEKVMEEYIRKYKIITRPVFLPRRGGGGEESAFLYSRIQCGKLYTPLFLNRGC